VASADAVLRFVAVGGGHQIGREARIHGGKAACHVAHTSGFDGGRVGGRAEPRGALTVGTPVTVMEVMAVPLSDFVAVHHGVSTYTFQLKSWHPRYKQHACQAEPRPSTSGRSI
jgi:hypothetical protein